MKSNKRHLKNLFVNSGLQFRIVFTSLVYMMLLVIIVSGIILYPLLMDMFLASDINAQYQSAQQFLSLAKRVLPAIMILLVLFFVHITFITHKICGPLVNFTHMFKKIGQGDFSSKVALRKGDYLKYECDKINEMIDKLSGEISKAKENHEHIFSELEDLSSHIEDPELSRRIKALLKKKGDVFSESGSL